MSKEKAKTEFLKRIDALKQLNPSQITIQEWQLGFIEGFVTESDGEKYYDGIKLKVVYGRPEPTKISA